MPSATSFGTFYPTFRKRKLRRGRTQSIEVPVFSGYIFIALNGLRWVPINSTYGVKKLLVRKAPHSEYNKPSEIVELFVRQLMQCSRKNDKHSWELSIGTEVTILRGPFAGRSAIVSWSSADRCRLLIWMLGRDDVQITVATSDVIAVSPRV